MAYIPIPTKAWVSETHDPGSRPTCDIWVTKKKPEDTGLVTTDGTKIYRIPEEIPIDFCR